MASTKIEKLSINVTRGDAVRENRISGKSNSGTYYLCNINDFDEYKHFINENEPYYLDVKQTYIYYLLLTQIFDSYKDKFIGKMKDLINHIKVLLNNDLEFYIRLRINDNRVFLRFYDNNDFYTKAFRHILYESISNIIIEIKNHKHIIYPSINVDSIINFNELIKSLPLNTNDDLEIEFDEIDVMLGE